MVRSSASDKHHAVQNSLKQAIDDTPPPNGQWRMEKVEMDQPKWCENGNQIRPDLYVRYYHAKGMGERYEVYYEIQNKMNETSFREKYDYLMVKTRESKHILFQVISEVEVPDRWDDMLAYLKDKVVVPW